MKENDEKMRRVVRGFMLNHKDMANYDKKITSSRIEDNVNRMKNMLTTGVEEMLDTIEGTNWKSNLLKRNARELRDNAEYVINLIDETNNPYKRSSTRRR